ALKVETRRARDRTRKREVRRQQQTPEQIERSRERHRQAYAKKPLRPFIGIDGEGGGTDAIGRQHYKMMGACDAAAEMVRILRKSDEPLITEECFEFLLSLPQHQKQFSSAMASDTTRRKCCAAYLHES